MRTCTPGAIKSSDRQYTKTDNTILCILIAVLIPLSVWAHWTQETFSLWSALIISFLYIIMLGIRFYSPVLNATIGSLLPFLIIGPSLFISDWFRAVEVFFLAVPIQCLAGIIIASIILFARKGSEGFHKNTLLCIAFSLIFSLFLLQLGGNWTAGILTIFFIGFLPAFLSFEVYHLASRKQFVLAPFRIGIWSGGIAGVIAICFMVGASHGESGLEAAAVSPFILLAFVIAGILVGYFYKWRGKPFCSPMIANFRES
jgi:hypothetical protein